MEILNPSRCTSSLYTDLEKDYLIGEEKLDGSRYLFYIGCDPYERNLSNNTFLSRTDSFKTVILNKGKIGEKRKVKIIGYRVNYLIGSIIK